ncbi:MAG: adenine deaminase [Succinivibrio sp.]|nr:adenine deaminase [Succinivibrio sp.]
MDKATYLKLKSVVNGEAKADLLLKNCRVINVFTGETISTNVGIKDGYFVYLSDEGSAKKEIDIEGKYLVPGLIDAHMHFESTVVTPRNFLSAAVKCGTTTFIADPHEAANVSGAKGIQYILDQTEDILANVFVMLPSCVPSTLLDDNGGIFSAEDMKPFLSNPRVLGLAEVMDVESVTSAKDSMFEKFELFNHSRIIDGHCPVLSGPSLTNYRIAGVDTDHESITFESALEKVRMGMQVLVREGSAAHNVEAIVKGILRSNIDTTNFCFCTDDRHIEDIRLTGHIDNNVRIAISLGLDPVKAIQMATINTARRYGLKRLGAIAPGYQADFLIVDDLKKFAVSGIFVKGENVAQFRRRIKTLKCPDDLLRTVNLDHISADRFKLPVGKESVHVIRIVPKQITTEDVEQHFTPAANFKPYGKYQKIASIERHKRTGLIGVAITEGYGLTNGAFAMTVSHDSHNVLVIGDSDDDMALAVNELIRLQGGIVLVEQGKIYEELALPIMGLMSDAPHDEVKVKMDRLKKKAHEMGVSQDIDPFITLSFLSLPVIPRLRIIPRGLCLVEEQTPVLL